ncbi:replication-relaxation family protein [Parasphingorhabdus halotolerans]|uniref:Replication-relaxation n=1 Tax=Parasphingorhabdus halotolerans TaxID=2725558 RepID=A0A6H2DNT8_9SPHN|nr:replication-relaxation family protein [Parasphingorhabdus halotolerans]QJB69858.1 hypothetical protein HF685_11695 [Parasphingorhabdus halotolerans]
MRDQPDIFGRRSRLKPSSTGKCVRPTKRDMLWFGKLAEHGPLPSSFLLDFANHSHASKKRAKERLTDLFHEQLTPHGGPYLIRPLQQFRTIDSRYNQLVYDLAPAAIEALAGDRDYDFIRPTRSGPWLHNFMVSCITASIELACLDDPYLNYIPQSQILRRAKVTMRYPTNVTDPVSGKAYRKDLVPDALFGIEYLGEQGSRFRFFAVEADRATEPATSQNFNRKSFRRHLLQYQQYIEQGLYKQHLNLTAPMLVLNVTTTERRLEKMLKVTERHFPDGCSYQLFQCWNDFGPVFTPPKPMPALLHRDWRRAEKEPRLCLALAGTKTLPEF